MKTMTFDIPDSIEISEREARSMLAAKLYETGRLSIGQAAGVAGYSKRTFIEMIGDFNVSLFTSNDLDNDILNATRYHI